MPVVPTEQNKLDLASVSGAKFEAADLSGTGLQALGSGMQSLGETGQKVADDQHKIGVEQHQAAIADDAAVKAAWNAYSDQARAIRANFYAQHGAAADAALQPSIEALHGAKAALHAELTSHRQQHMFDRAVQGPLGYDVIGFNAYAARAKGVEQDNQSIIAQQGLAHDAAHNADNPAFAAKLLETGSESIKTQAIVQGRDPASVDEKVAKYRSSIHLDVILGPKGHDPLAAHHYLAMNSGDMIEPHKLEAARLLAPALGQLRGVADIDSYPMLRSATEPATPPGDIATVTGRILEVEAARRTGDAGGEQTTSAPGVADASATRMLALMQRYRGSAPKSLAASLLGTDAVDALVAKHGKDWFGALPGEAYKAVAHDMGMIGAGTSPREAPAPEDRAAVAGWIDAQPWDDARKQTAHEELHTRAGLEGRRRTEIRDKAKEAAFATIDKLGTGFISVNQLPPAVRRDLGEEALAALTLRADRNVHPMTVPPHGDVAASLNKMAATDPEAFSKIDLRLYRDKIASTEYRVLGKLHDGHASYPPGAPAITQQRAVEKMAASGLNLDLPANSGDAGDDAPGNEQSMTPDAAHGDGDQGNRWGRAVSALGRPGAPQVEIGEDADGPGAVPASANHGGASGGTAQAAVTAADRAKRHEQISRKLAKDLGLSFKENPPAKPPPAGTAKSPGAGTPAASASKAPLSAATPATAPAKLLPDQPGQSEGRGLCLSPVPDFICRSGEKGIRGGRNIPTGNFLSKVGFAKSTANPRNIRETIFLGKSVLRLEPRPMALSAGFVPRRGHFGPKIRRRTNSF